MVGVGEESLTVGKSTFTTSEAVKIIAKPKETK